MTIKTESAGLSRRMFVRLAVGVVGASPVLVGACAPSLPRASVGGTTTAPGPATGTGSTGSVYPTYIPTQNGPKPDYASDGPLYEDGYDNYPKNPQKSWLKDPPGAGSTVTAVSPGLYPPSHPLDQNPAWQAVNKALNASVSFNIVPQQDYVQRLATIMAGNDLPDLLNMTAGINGAAGAAQFLEAQAADLTPYLAGDAVKNYPNLAALPTFAWKNAGCAYQGKLYMIPIERYAPGTFFFKNDNIYDTEIGGNVVPKSSDDFKKILTELNKPDQDRWATATYGGMGYDVVAWSQIFGGPNNWRLEPNGNLTKNFETAEMRATTGYLRDLVAAGLFHPNSLNYNLNSRRADFVAGRMAILPEGFGNPWNDFWGRGLKENPPINFHPLPPFPAQEGGKPVHYLSVGFQSATALKKASADRIQELLRIVDYLAAPFGSAEDLLLIAGIPGVDYSLDANGNPQPIGDNLNLDANYVNWKYIVQHPQVMYLATIPGYAKAEYDAEHLAIPYGIPDPSLGFFSPTLNTKNVTLNQAFLDGITDVVLGRRPLADYDQLVTDWQNNGGNQIRKELLDAMASSNL
ncbi:MAG: hypothetical protein JO020_21425 [Chloroflexi bacterium]|nr:hypothetical protein [Chloroflexota bacterium]